MTVMVLGLKTRLVEVADRSHVVGTAMRVDDDFFDIREFGNDVGVGNRTADTVGVARDDNFGSCG